MMLAKSVVGGTATGDVFENVAPGAIAFAPPARPAPAPREDRIAFGLDGAWRFYPQFWRAHGVENALGPDPFQASVRPAAELRVPMYIRNGSATNRDVTLVRTGELPAGWTEQPVSTIYALAPGDTYRIEPVLTSPATEAPTPFVLSYELRSGTETVGRVALNVSVRLGSMPQ
jgi:hypothetical protein